jgi:Xaa-Pro aminopeptidase
MKEKEELKERRKKLFNRLGDGVGILFSAEEFIRNGDTPYSYRQDSDFYYFTGFNEPNAVAIFLPACDKAGEQFILFNQPRDPKIERWVGPLAGQEGAREIYDADLAFDIKQLDEKIMTLLAGKRAVFYKLGKNKNWDQKISTWISELRAISHRSLGAYPVQLSDLSIIAHEMRLVKSLVERDRLKKACDISAVAHRKLLEIARPGLYEYELEAKFEYEIKIRGCRSLAYPVIAGGGRNACTLHYGENKDELRAGDLVLIDAGGEYENYAADITRTFPVNGKFTEDQARIYELVLNAQLAVIEAIKPGVHWNCLEETAIRYIIKGLIELGILQGPQQEVIADKSYREYYLHSIGHWLGLDVHDVGPYRIEGQWCELQEGMVLTVEPGLYFPAKDDLDSRWWNIGVRIEDDVLVTAEGCQVLTTKAPKTIDEIEAIMGATAIKLGENGS